MAKNAFGTLGSLLSKTTIEGISKEIAIAENRRRQLILHERMVEMAKKMRLNLSNPNSYTKVLKALDK